MDVTRSCMAAMPITIRVTAAVSSSRLVSGIVAPVRRRPAAGTTADVFAPRRVSIKIFELRFVLLHSSLVLENFTFIHIVTVDLYYQIIRFRASCIMD